MPPPRARTMLFSSRPISQAEQDDPRSAQAVRRPRGRARQAAAPRFGRRHPGAAAATLPTPYPRRHCHPDTQSSQPGLESPAELYHDRPHTGCRLARHGPQPILVSTFSYFVGATHRYLRYFDSCQMFDNWSIAGYSFPALPRRAVLSLHM